MRKTRGWKPGKSGDAAAKTNGSRRELMQAAAGVAGGGLLAGGVLDPEELMAAAQEEPERYLTPDRIAATPTFKYRPYRSKRQRVYASEQERSDI